MPLLRIGVFFDGTGNNAHNYLSQHPLKEKKEDCKCYSDECEQIALFGAAIDNENADANVVGYSMHESISYKNPLTNIWHLYNHYESGKTTLGYQVGIYVGGCGTIENEEDDMVAMGTGWPGWTTPHWDHGPSFRRKTGVIDKTETAIELIDEKLKKVASELADFSFDSVEFELFGFSRGSTSARHFANRIASKDKRLVKMIKTDLGSKIYPTIATNPSGSINFIGLFDSVAAIAALSDLSVKVNDSHTGKIKIDLTKVDAKKVFHITAGHEMRYNFSLNRALPAARTKELELPGAHSDIGGGYTLSCDERLFISKPFTSEEKKDTAFEETKAHADAKAEMQRLLEHPLWGPIWKLCEDNVKIVNWSSNDRKLHNALHSTRLFGSAVIMRRLDIHAGIMYIALNAMRQYSVQNGGSLFKEFGSDESIAPPKIPEDLLPLSEAVTAKLQEVAQSGDESMMDSVRDKLAPELAKKYVHCSAYYGAIDADVKVLDTIAGRFVPKTYVKQVLLTNRPTDNFVRSEFNSLGEEFKR